LVNLEIILTMATMGSMKKRLIRSLRLAFRTPAVPSSSDESRRESDRRIVSRVSSGNIRLQRGEYVTRADLEEQYERVSEDS